METVRLDLVAAQDEGKALADVPATWVEAEKIAEEEFEVGVFQGYSDLKEG